MDIVDIQNINYKKMIVFLQVFFYIIDLTKVKGIDFESAVLNLYYRSFS